MHPAPRSNSAGQQSKTQGLETQGLETQGVETQGLYYMHFLYSTRILYVQ